MTQPSSAETLEPITEPGQPIPLQTPKTLEGFAAKFRELQAKKQSQG